MKTGFPSTTGPRVKTRPLLLDMQKINKILGTGEKGLIALHKMLRPEKEGGISQGQRDLRKQIWDKILAHSFGGDGNIRILEKEILPYSNRIEHIRGLGHVVLRGRLNKEGRLEAGRSFARFDRYGGAEYLLEMNEGIPLRIFLLDDGSAFEFFPLVDNKTGKVVDVHRGKIKREKLMQLGDATTYTYLGRVEGGLFLGGYRPKIGGQGAEEKRPWAKFTNNPDEKVKIVIKDGILQRCTSLESDLDAEFALVWDRAQDRYVTSFWGGMYEDEFNQLNENHEIHNSLLSRDGSLHLGGRDWLDLGPRYRYHRVRITDIRNPSGIKAFIAAAEVVKGDKVLAAKKLSVIYEIPEESPPESFAKGGLINVFEKWSKDKLVQADGAVPDSYILAGIHTNSFGELIVGGYWGRFSQFPNARLEAKVINHRPALVKFVADREGEPILDADGEPLILKIDPEIQRGRGLKSQMIAHSLWGRQEKINKLNSLFSEGLKLHGEGKLTESKKLFKRMLRIVRREFSPSPEMEELAEKARGYLRSCRRPRPKAKPKPVPKPKPKPIPKPVAEPPTPKPAPKPTPKPKPKPKPKPIPKPVAEPPAPTPSPSPEAPSASRLIDALIKKGADLVWVAWESGISPKRLRMIRKGSVCTKSEILKIRETYIKFAVENRTKKKARRK